jgi:hypothetical protein
MNKSTFSILIMNLGWVLTIIGIMAFFFLDAGDPECQVVPPDHEVFLEFPNE